jgi:outer membrane biosynthesis protein TonB
VGYWLQVPRDANVIQLTDVDLNDLPPKGDPDADQAQPEEPPQPEPTPPPEPEPTPPPLDSTPEFEIPAPSPTPVPSPPSQPKPSPKQRRPSPSTNPNPAATPGAKPGPNKGLASGVKGGTGNGGSRSGLFLQQPKPPYPGAAREMLITGNVTVTLTIAGGRIVAVHGNGPAILASAAASWIRANWVPAPNTSGTYELPIVFRLN